MKKLLTSLLLIILFSFGIVEAATPPTTTFQGGTGVNGIANGNILFGQGASNLRIGTSSLYWDSTNSALGVGTNTPTAVNANSHLTVSGISSQDIIASTTDNTTLSDAIFNAYAPGSRVFLGAHGTNQITAQYGIVTGSWGELAAVNSSSGTSNGLLIGTRTTNTPIVFGTNSTEKMRITGAGQVGIGSSTPGAALSVHAIAGTNYPNNTLFSIGSSTASATTTLFTVLNTGNVGIASTSPWRTFSSQGTVALNGLTAFTTGDSAICQRAGGEITVDSGISSCIVSSQFVKHNILPSVSNDAISHIRALNPVSFNYNDSNQADIGLIAESVSKVDSRYAQYTTIKSTVDGHTFNPGDPKAINWSAITSDLIKTVQTILNRLDGTDKRLDLLEKQIVELQSQISLLKQAK